MKTKIFFLLLFCFVTEHVSASKEITIGLFQYGGSSNVYNMRGCELYFIKENNKIFVNKIDEFKFIVSDSLERLMIADTNQNVQFLILNSNYEMTVKIPRSIFVENKFLGLGFLEDKQWGLRVDLSFGYWGTVIRDIVVKPNKLWKSKYYPRPIWDR